MTSSSFLFFVRVPVEEENSVNDKDKETDAKKLEDAQTNTRKGSESSNGRSSEVPGIDSNDKTGDLKGVTLSDSSDVEGSEHVTPVKPEGQDEKGTSSVLVSQPSSTEEADISTTPSDPSAIPVPSSPGTSDTSTSGTSDPSPIGITDPSVAEDTELLSPPPWDFTPPPSPGSTSAPQDADTIQAHDSDTQNSSQAPQKDSPSSAWTFPPSETLEKETPLVQNSVDKAPEDSEPVSESEPPQSQETTVAPQSAQTSPIPVTEPSSNKTSDSTSEGISDSTSAEKEGQDVSNKPVESTDTAPTSGDDSTKKLSTENNDKPRKSIDVDAEKDNDKDLEIFVKTESLFQRTLSALENYTVKNLSVHKTTNGKSFQFVFVEEGENCEEILNKLAEIGIGDNAQSSISMFETSIYKGAGGVMDEEEEDEEDLYNSAANPDEQKQSEFKKSIKARMLVTEVVNSVQGNAEFTFDFLVLVLLASSISAMGLVENSSVVLVASMLVSPIMGPILAGTFGTVIQNNTLRNLGIRNEVLSLLICVGMGLAWGLVCGGVCKDGAFWGSTDAWPTSEMKSRGMTRSLWTGILIALPSGAGVALSILGGNTGSLVGVAISASLLPPAVNAGMLWASAIIASIEPPPRVQTVTPPTSTIQYNVTQTRYNVTQTNNTATDLPISLNLTPGLNCVPLDRNAYIPVYSCDMAEEMLYLGLFSLLLTILNIICIIIMGIIVLKIKEVAPQMALSEDTKTFWKEDIKIAKESYVTMKGNQSKSLSQQARALLNEWRQENGDQPIQLLQLERMTQEIDDDPSVQEIQSRIPGGMRGDLVSRHFVDQMNKDEEEMDSVSPQYKTFHTFHNMYGHSRRDFRSSYHASPNMSTGSMRRKKFVSTSLTEVNEKNVPYSADGPLKPKKSPGHFAKAFGILRHPRAGRSNLFRRRHDTSQPEEKQLRFAVQKVPDEEVKVHFLKEKEKDKQENDNQNVSVPLLERKESV
ncbi:uncharacterized protein LOC110462543 [Mizuhopecten yessoensis]|uniref:Uncharacterized protein n=1 Tax=Mizuhopecten yessoensis TaxID=6573 RepID=A0A210PY32_MIZYE|nr:uncharacterized protein LOC110462543 [Mizuhopecten yessoensis]OWF41400.1 hypothetical protein KP79_PYT08421 [Mizuhopecten yessoensis]